MEQNNAAKDMAGTFSHMKKNGTLRILIIVLVIGVVLFTVGSIIMNDDEGKNDDGSAKTEEGEKLIGFFEYKTLIEEEVERLCQGVSGVKSASAIAFFDNVGGSIYAQNVQSGGAQSQKSEYVIIGSGSNSHALYLGESLPDLSGIGVVCNTGGDINKRNELCALLSAAYGIPMTRIYVSEASH